MPENNLKIKGQNTPFLTPQIDEKTVTQKCEEYLQTLITEVSGSTPPNAHKLCCLLGWQNQPYSLVDHFQFIPLYNLSLTPYMIWLCGRQVGKTATSANSRLILSIILPYLRQLCVTPLFSQVQRYSREYIANMLAQSAFYDSFVDNTCRRGILSKTLKNGSAFEFSYAWNDVTRIRSISGIDMVHIDEYQNINPSFVPVIRATMHASKKFACTLYTGTPLSLDNEIQLAWENSSQAHWTIKCPACNKENISSLAFDMERMLQPAGLSCAKCGHLLNTRTGYYLHAFPDRILKFPGYHVPQPLHPYHCEIPHKWKLLIDEYKTWPRHQFVNEILGESWDSAHDPLTQQQLRDCCNVDGRKNTIEEAVKRLPMAEFTILAVDWSGNGQLGISTTGISLIAKLQGRSVLDVLYMERLPATQAHQEDAFRIAELLKNFKVDYFVHDYGGGGNVRETTVIQMGIPAETSVVPITFSFAPRQPIMKLSRGGKGARSSYILDKPRALDLMYACLRTNKVIFPEYESCATLIQDLRNLAQETHETPRGSPYIIYVERKGRMTDMAMSLNMGLLAGWYIMQALPELTEQTHINKLSDDDIQDMDPSMA